jgi:hypothetical protein
MLDPLDPQGDTGGAEESAGNRSGRAAARAQGGRNRQNPKALTAMTVNSAMQ